jgi:hypothetical protein
MGEFDRETDAVLGQLNYAELSEVPGGEFVEIVGDLLKLIGTGGLWGLAGGVSNLALKVRKLAGASYSSNLVYAIGAVRNDLATLYERYETLRGRIDALPTDPEFAEAISALALRAMYTSVKDRLRRLARIVVNGVKEYDLEPESLDDMMRAAVELKESDIILLGKLYGSQNRILCEPGMNPQKWHGDIQSEWKRFISSGNLNPREHLGYRSSFSRLESAGFVKWIPSAGDYGVGLEIYGLMLEGKKFYERLQEIAVQQ